MPPAVFISYSHQHQDERWKDALVRQLGVLEREGLLATWHDGLIEPGADWLAVIETAMAEAQVAVFIVSAYFLNSEFVRNKEIPALLERRRGEGLRIIPLIARPCPWQQVPWLAAIQARPLGGKTLAGLSRVKAEQVLSDLAEDILRLAAPPADSPPGDPAPRTSAPPSDPPGPPPAVQPTKDYPLDLSPYVHRIYDQAGEGSGPAFAAITAMEAAFAVAGSLRSLSARYVNDKAKQVEHESLPSEDVYGVYFTSIAYVVQKFGAPPSSIWPYTSDLHSLPPGLTWKELDKLASQSRVRLLGPISIDEISEQLRKGRPLIAAVNAYNIDSIWYKTSTGVIDLAPQIESSFGTHVIAIVGFDAKDGAIKFANSWGAKWGQKGFGFLTKAGAEAYLVPDEIWAVEPGVR